MGIGAKTVAMYLKNKSTIEMKKFYFLGVVIMSFGFILAFWQSHILIALFFFMMAGIGDGIAEVSFVTRIQQNKKNLRLFLFSTMSMMQQSGFRLGMLISAFIFSLLSASYVVTIFHSISLCTIAVFYIYRFFIPAFFSQKTCTINNKYK